MWIFILNIARQEITILINLYYEYKNSFNDFRFLVASNIVILFLLREQSVEIETLESGAETVTETQEQSNVVVVIDITSRASDSAIIELASKFRELPNIEKVSTFSSTETLMYFRDANRSDNSAMEEIENLGSNPFPARIKLEVSSEADMTAQLRQLTELDTGGIINSTTVGNEAMYEF